MSPSVLSVEDGESNVIPSSIARTPDNGSNLKERNYLRSSDCSSDDSFAVLTLAKESNSNLNLKATELRLGLPGSQSPERESNFSLLNSGKLDEKLLFPLLPSKDGICAFLQKNVISGNKRVFSDTMEGFSELKNSVRAEGNWMFCGDGSTVESSQPVGIKTMLLSMSTGTQPAVIKEALSRVQHELPCKQAASNSSSAPAAKAQVVGWPPIRSYRKNTLATTSKIDDEVDGKPIPGALFVKVSMDGAPYLRKVDLKMYTTYQELSSALESMFSCFTIGQCGSHGAPGREILSESKLRDLLHGSEFVLTYEDKDDDWMLVGDVPWEMFMGSCKRLKIMKSSDAIGLAPRAIEKSKNGN